MARISYVQPNEASANVRQRLENAPHLRILQLVAHAEGVFDHFLRLSTALLRDLSLQPHLREIAILRVAALTPGAAYEWVQHEAIGRGLGLTSGDIEGARSGVGLHGDKAIVAAFTEEVVREASPSDATFALAADRFSERELIELLLVVGQYMMLGRIMSTSQIDLDKPVTLESLTARSAAR